MMVMRVAWLSVEEIWLQNDDEVSLLMNLIDKVSEHT
jgi:hypothetical protein